MKTVIYRSFEKALTYLFVFLVFIKLFIAKGELSFGIFYSYFFYTIGFVPLWYLISEHERLYFHVFFQSRDRNILKYYLRNYCLGIVYIFCLVGLLVLTNFIGSGISIDIIINIGIVFLFSLSVSCLVISLYHLLRGFLSSYLSRLLIVVLGFIATYNIIVSNFTMPHMLINVLTLSRGYILMSTGMILGIGILITSVYLIMNRGESIYERT